MESHFVFNKTITLLGLAEYAMMNINQLGEAPRQMIFAREKIPSMHEFGLLQNVVAFQ